MIRLLLLVALVSFGLGVGCNSRNDEPVTVRHRFFDTKQRLPPRPIDSNR
jgi:hypothetical protein